MMRRLPLAALLAALSCANAGQLRQAASRAAPALAAARPGPKEPGNAKKARGPGKVAAAREHANLAKKPRGPNKGAAREPANAAKKPGERGPNKGAAREHLNAAQKQKGPAKDAAKQVHFTAAQKQKGFAKDAAKENHNAGQKTTEDAAKAQEEAAAAKAKEEAAALKERRKRHFEEQLIGAQKPKGPAENSTKEPAAAEKPKGPAQDAATEHGIAAEEPTGPAEEPEQQLLSEQLPAAGTRAREPVQRLRELPPAAGELARKIGEGLRNLLPAAGALAREKDTGGVEKVEVQEHIAHNVSTKRQKEYADYTHGHAAVPLFPFGLVPGERIPHTKLVSTVPAFDPGRKEKDLLRFTDATSDDPIAHKCTPGGIGIGHFFYNVMTPELVPFVLDKNETGRTDVGVIVAPGGGGIHVAWDVEGVSTAHWLNSIGISAFVLKYRVPDSEQNFQKMDAQRAVSVVRQNAKKYGLNASRVGWMGFDAGGSMGILAFSEANRTYKRIDAVDDVSYQPDFLMLLYPGIPTECYIKERIQRLPPLLMAFASDDNCVFPMITGAWINEVKRHSAHKALNFIQEYGSGKHNWGGECKYFKAIAKLPACGWRKEIGEPYLRRIIHGKQGGGFFVPKSDKGQPSSVIEDLGHQAAVKLSRFFQRK